MFPDWFLALSFLTIAFIYASVGFGGGSSYLALLAVAGLPFAEIRLTALICNIIVVTGGALIFLQHKQVDFRKILPLAAMSVPLAFAGAKLRMEEHLFFKLLAVSLLAASVLLWFPPRKSVETLPARPPKPLRDGLLGASIGFLSGLVGIGGGIFLAPVLHFLRWDTARKIAAAASIFILVNSLSGIAGQLAHLPADLHLNRIALLGAAVFVGGQAGARLSVARFDPLIIRRLTALLVFAAGVEVLWRHLS